MWDKPGLLNWIANILFGMCFGAVVYVGFLLVFNASAFPLKEVSILGDLNHIKPAQLALVVEKKLKGGFFLVNLKEAHDAFENLDWVKKASVRRRWPDSIEVVIEEHKPLAKWGASGLVSTKGDVFNEMVGDDLPVFVGPEASAEMLTKQYELFNQILKPIDMQIIKLTMTERTAWQLMTQSGLTIELGRMEVETRLKRFVKIYQSTIEKLNKQLTYADLRYPNGFAIRKPNEQVL